MFMHNATPARVRLVCSVSICPRTVSLPVPLFLREHGIDCDRCGAAMRVVGCSAGVDPTNGAVVWSDREPSSQARRRKNDPESDEYRPLASLLASASA